MSTPAAGTMKYGRVRNYYGGQFVESSTSDWLDVMSPIDGTLLSQVPMSTSRELDAAVESAKTAFESWSKSTIKDRAQVFFRYRYLLEKYADELTALVAEENGKTWDEAKAEVEKSIELTEFACSMPQLVSGELLEVSKGVECRVEHFPVGVVASIVPFNFPLMVPNWTMPNALVLGNTMIMKPSELVPLSCQRMAEILKEAGLPDGVFNVVNGGRETVEGICDHDGIEAVSFVGSTKVAKLVYQRSTNSLKRCVALGGAKNHLFVLPDANPTMTATNVAASMSGCAGQRCMAASAMLAVGNVDPIIDQICEEAKKIVPGKNLGAVISKEAKERIERYIGEAERDGAKVLVDGRGATVEGKEDGTYVGPTVIDYVTPEMSVAREEIFGPVISIMRTKTLEEAVEIENKNPYGNAAAVFTQSGGLARYVTEHANAGMIGVNIGEAERDGAKVLVDGRGATVEGKENGTYVGPTVIDHVTPEMSVAREEIFGPVISIMRTKTLEEAVEIENKNPYGNAAAVFTQSGGLARYVTEHANAGMIGVNIGVPVPREPFSFGGWNESRFGANDITGKSSIEFWTKLKKTTTKWNPESRTNWMS